MKTAESISFTERARRMRAEGRDVFILSVGDPHFSPPDPIKEGVVQAMEEGKTHYVDSRGIPELRELIARKWLKGSYSPEEVCVTPGVKQGLFYLLWALEGVRKILLLSPCWLGYRHLAELLGKEVLTLPNTRLEEAERLDFDLVILNSPNNPDGRVFNASEVDFLLGLCERKGAFLVSDEVYSLYDYSGKFVSLADRVGEKVFLLDGFSKKYAMAGLRLGFVAGKKREILNKLVLLQQHVVTCASSAVQYGALSFPKCTMDLQKFYEYYRYNRDLVKQVIPKFEPFCPDGGLYYFINLEILGITLDGTEFAHHLLERFSVAVVPGSAYGREFSRWFRLSFCVEYEELKKALERLAEAIKEAKG